MANFFSDFCKAVNQPTVMSSYLSYLFEKKNFKKFCFVEGIADSSFYSYILYKKINVDKKSIKYISCGNKDNVIQTLRYFNNKEKENLNNLYFIIDKDYDYQKYMISNDLNKLSFTKYYSIENYLFEEYNLNKVLSFLNLQDCENELFKSLLNDFIGKVLLYEALNLYIVSLDLSKPMELQDISEKDIQINDNKVIIKENILDSVSKIISDLNNENFKKYNEKLKYLEKNNLSIRGHDLELFFDILLKYFRIKSNLSCLMKNKQLIESLEIDLDIK